MCRKGIFIKLHIFYVINESAAAGLRPNVVREPVGYMISRTMSGYLTFV